jgi:hypothetical protein
MTVKVVDKDSFTVQTGPSCGFESTACRTCDHLWLTYIRYYQRDAVYSIWLLYLKEADDRVDFPEIRLSS